MSRSTQEMMTDGGQVDTARTFEPEGHEFQSLHRQLTSFGNCALVAKFF